LEASVELEETVSVEELEAASPSAVEGEETMLEAREMRSAASPRFQRFLKSAGLGTAVVAVPSAKLEGAWAAREGLMAVSESVLEERACLTVSPSP